MADEDGPNPHHPMTNPKHIPLSVLQHLERRLSEVRARLMDRAAELAGDDEVQERHVDRAVEEIVGGTNQ